MLRRPLSLGKGENRISTQEIGAIGEKVACEWFWARGCKVLYRNFRAPGGGEIDIVVRDGAELCFVEVKTRTKIGAGRPLDAVDAPKQELIEKGAREWLRLLRRDDMPRRFDVVEVFLIEGEKPQVSLVKNAF